MGPCRQSIGGDLLLSLPTGFSPIFLFAVFCVVSELTECLEEATQEATHV